MEYSVSDWLFANKESENLLSKFRSAYEKELLNQLMMMTNNNKSEAARKLGIDRAILRKKLRQYNLL